MIKQRPGQVEKKIKCTSENRTKATQFIFFALTNKTSLKAGEEESRQNHKMEDRRRQHGGPSDAVIHTLLISCQIATERSSAVPHIAVRETKLFVFHKCPNGRPDCSRR